MLKSYTLKRSLDSLAVLSLEDISLIFITFVLLELYDSIFGEHESRTFNYKNFNKKKSKE